MTLHLSSGPARVLAAGTVTTWFGHPLELRLELPEGPLRVSLAFRTDPDDPKVRVLPTRHLGGWHFEAVNFDTNEGRGTSEPALLGAFGTDLVFLHFRAFRYGQTPDHTVHYTFHRVPAAHAAAPSPKAP